jgi:protein disulfide-isomerase
MGSGWCPWTEKLDKEILSESGFLNIVTSQVNLVWLNCPSQKNATTSQVQELKSRYEVDELPTLVVISPSQEEMFRLGYLPMSPSEYAHHLESMITDYQEIHGKVDNHNLSDLPVEELEPLYLKARDLKCRRYADSLMQVGVEKDKSTFFLLEKYAEHLASGNKQEAEPLREKILERDPKNLKGSQLRLAILDFQIKAQNLKKKANPRSAVKPLLEYLKKFGEKDKENVWKVEMMMAQFLFTKNEVSEALQHANASYTSAPDSHKLEIAETIDYLKTYVK